VVASSPGVRPSTCQPIPRGIVGVRRRLGIYVSALLAPPLGLWGVVLGSPPVVSSLSVSCVVLAMSIQRGSVPPRRARFLVPATTSLMD
jgi:hypothetical protein